MSTPQWRTAFPFRSWRAQWCSAITVRARTLRTQVLPNRPTRFIDATLWRGNDVLALATSAKEKLLLKRSVNTSPSLSGRGYACSCRRTFFAVQLTRRFTARLIGSRVRERCDAGFVAPYSSRAPGSANRCSSAGSR